MKRLEADLATCTKSLSIHVVMKLTIQIGKENKIIDQETRF